MSGAGATWDRDTLAHALVVSHRYSISVSQVATDALGVSQASNSVVQTLNAIFDAGTTTPSELVTALGIPRSTMARMVNRLEGLGFVARWPDDVDHRQTLVGLTPKGMRRVKKARSALADFYRAGHVAIKESLDRLDDVGLDAEALRPVEPHEATALLAATGAAYLDEVLTALQPFAVSEAADRFTLALLDLNVAMRPSQIGGELGMTPSGTSGLLTRLEAEGLIVRSHDLVPADRRAVRVELTDRGREAACVQLTVFSRHAPAIFNAVAATGPPG